MRPFSELTLILLSFCVAAVASANTLRGLHGNVASEGSSCVGSFLQLSRFVSFYQAACAKRVRLWR